jgi:hypothetical protein
MNIPLWSPPSEEGGFTETILKRDDEKRLVWGWASVIEENGEVVVDVQGDVLDEGELMTAAHDFVTEARAGKLMHQGRRIGRVVESLVFTKALQKALGIDLGKVGWFICMKVEDDRVWAAVKDGTLRAFSIGGSSRRVKIA